MTLIRPESAPAFGPTALLTPANGLTFVRIAATPIMLMFILQRRLDAPTFAMWVLLCSTDGADGFLARRYGVTRSGAFLDPLADKFLVLGAMLVLAWKDVFAWPLVAVIAVREIGMSVYRSIAGAQGISIPASRGAKLKTVVQQVAVGFAIVPWIGEHANWAAKWLLGLAAVLTVWTGLQYLGAARRRIPNP